MAERLRVLIIAGPNGSGKSTLTTSKILAQHGILPEHYINADEIAKELAVRIPEYSAEQREREAFRQARTLRQNYREQGISFAFETVFSHPSTLLDMQKCRASGFEVFLFFVTTKSAQINVARIVGRVRSGGHNVPEDRIRARYERTMRLFPRIVEEADSAYVYDNSGSTVLFFPFENGILLPSSDAVPVYLRRRLIEPLTRRQSERDAIRARLGATFLPNEENSVTTGILRWVSENYFVQEAASNPIRHDRLLIASELTIGSKQRIYYKEGVGNSDSVA